MNLTNLAIELAVWSFLAFGAALFILQIAAREMGFWLGCRVAAKTTAPPEGVGVMVGAMMGLFAFVLALTLSFANTRFTERQAGTLAEANAIGTAWLRAGAIGHPHGDEIARLLEDYTRLRADFVRSPEDRAALAAINDRTGTLQTQIWAQLSALVRERPDPITASLMSAINEAFDASTTERFAFTKQLPPSLVWLLIGMALLSIASLGFQLGLRGTPLRIMGMLLAGMWTIVIISIFDLAATRLGSIRTSAVVYEWAMEAARDGAPIPPSPPSGR